MPRPVTAHAEGPADELAPVRTLLVPPPPEAGSVPAWHMLADVSPLRPLPTDLADSLGPRVPRARRTRESGRITLPTPLGVRLGRVMRGSSARLALAVALGALSGLGVGMVLREARTHHAATR